jgi:hypothetical protein
MLVLVLVEEEGEGSGLALGLLEILHPQKVPLVPSRHLHEKNIERDWIARRVGFLLICINTGKGHGFSGGSSS